MPRHVHCGRSEAIALGHTGPRPLRERGIDVAEVNAGSNGIG